jgi:hypothetical protein
MLTRSNQYQATIVAWKYFAVLAQIWGIGCVELYNIAVQQLYIQHNAALTCIYNTNIPQFYIQPMSNQLNFT